MKPHTNKIIRGLTRPAFIAVAAFFAATNQARAAQTNRPNVLFIVVDDLRPELGCYGRDYIKSPNIDRLARAGMVFDRAYCQQAVCSPTRSSLLTGTRPDTTKVWDLKTHFRTALPDVVTLQQNFKNHGYFVQGMGKIFHGGFNDPVSWSVPWVTPKAVTYALPENVVLNSSKAESDPDGNKGDNSGAGLSSYSLPENPALSKSNVASDVAEQKPKTTGKKSAGANQAADVVAGEIPPSRHNSRGPAYE
jgi:iduronate 2-sulfatase